MDKLPTGRPVVGGRPRTGDLPEEARLGVGIVGLHEGHTLLVAAQTCGYCRAVAACDLADDKLAAAGGTRQAVEKGDITGGIMHAGVKHNVKMVLAGSVRDDGPMPEVITDMVVSPDAMRSVIRDVGLVLMVATTLHSVATGNILPAWIPAVCADINPSVLAKLAGRWSFQTIGIVSDVEPFFRSLVQDLSAFGVTATALD
ncbi:MAG: hypothetical protein HZB38_16725 [Planctomycetes bacterium]|nr:hypothetical protein [Planctomycetota bacterium]